jgi:hypothetical protein
MSSIITADNGAVSGNAGLRFISDSSGILQFNTGNNTIALTISPTQYISANLYGMYNGIIPAEQFYRTDAGIVGLNTTATQDALAVGVTLKGNTIYKFEGIFGIKKTADTTSQVVQWGFGGTATVRNIIYHYIRYFDATSSLTSIDDTAAGAVSQTVANVTTMTSSTSATNSLGFYFRGLVEIETNGTFIPRYRTTGAVGPYTMQPGSYFRISPLGPLGASGENIRIGNWS